MIIAPSDHRPFGNTGLHVPSLAFPTCALANARRVITDPAKLEICGAWFEHVAPPIFIELWHDPQHEAATRAIARALAHLEIGPKELTISLRLASDDDRLTPESVMNAIQDTCRTLGGSHRPQLVSIDVDLYLAAAPADRIDRMHDVVRTCRDLAQHKETGELAGIGLATRDWRSAEEIERAVALDWLQLVGGLTIMHHPPELLDFLVELAGRRVAVVLSSISHGGFLLGGVSKNGGEVAAHPSNGQAHAWRKSFVALCQGHGISPQRACIQFCLHAPGVEAVMIDTSYADRVAENAAHAVTKVPDAFWDSMKEERLLESDYPHFP